MIVEPRVADAEDNVDAVEVTEDAEVEVVDVSVTKVVVEVAVEIVTNAVRRDISPANVPKVVAINASTARKRVTFPATAQLLSLTPVSIAKRKVT